MLYLWSLHKKEDLSWFGDRDRVDKAMKELENGYRQHFGGDVRVLGGQVVEGSLPREPDTFVVATCLTIAKKNNLHFDSDRDEISYSVDMLDGREVGVCRIRIESRQTSPTAKVKEDKPITNRKSRSRSGWVLSIAGGLLVGAGLLIGLLFTIIQLTSPTAANNVTGFVDIMIICPLPLIVVGGVLLAIGILALRKRRITSDDAPVQSATSTRSNQPSQSVENLDHTQ